MAKSQKRSSREAKKPKQQKAPPAATPPFGGQHKANPTAASRKTPTAR